MSIDGKLYRSLLTKAVKNYLEGWSIESCPDCYKEAADRLVAIAKQFGIYMTRKEAIFLWEHHSGAWGCSGIMSLDDAEEKFPKIISQFIDYYALGRRDGKYDLIF